MRQFAICLVLILGACMTPAPPRPAMAPVGQNGDFGYSERDIGPDRIEVTYRGAPIRVSASNPRGDSRVQFELDKAHDLALWRAVQVAKDRGAASVRIEQETRNSDIDQRSRPVYRPGPFYDPFWPHYHPYGWHGPFYGGGGYYAESRWATARAVVTLTVFLSRMATSEDGALLPVGPTLERLTKARGQEVY